MEIDPVKTVMVGDSVSCDGACQMFGMTYLQVVSNEDWRSRLLDLLDDKQFHRRKLTKVSEYTLIGDFFRTKIKHLSEPLDVGDTFMVDNTEYEIIKSFQGKFTKDDCIYGDKQMILKYQVKEVL